MKTKTKLFLRFFTIFALLYFLISYYIPFFRGDNEIIYIAVRSLITAILYALFMTWYTSKKNEKK